VAGAAITGELTLGGHALTDSGVCFELATSEHDASIRRLLRENPMPGPIRLSLEREPSFFAAAALEGPEQQTIVALEGERVVAAGSISTRQRFINGQPMQVGYLGALRLDSSCRGRASILRRGYEAFRRLHSQGGPKIYLTSIMADNLPARRFLERGLSGMPTYRFLGEFVTLVIRRADRLEHFRLRSRARRKLSKQGIKCMRGSKEQGAEILDLLRCDHQKYQFAPVWSANELHPESIQVACQADGRPVACAALWDQRSIKQIVVRGYSSPLKWARPVLNFGARCLGQPVLPRIGTTLSHAFVSHVAFSPDQTELAESLIHLLRVRAAARGIDYVTLGFDSRDPRLKQLRAALHPREYRSRLYVVHWEDGEALAQNLDDRLLAPEVALL